MMKVNIYYGGRGLIEDPTIYVMNKITEVLEELNVTVKRYNLYEDKRSISVLPKTLKEADAVIFAASVEWFGIGGLLQQFLDACWLYGDQETIQKLYMMPVVLSTTYGERDSYLQLKKAWDLLNGLPGDGICAYVENHVDFETNPNYAEYIEKRVENFYRTFTKRLCVMPSSDNAVHETVTHSAPIQLTPQESEQLSMYVSDETYVKTQKADIQELTAMFRKELGDESEEETAEEQPKEDIYISKFKEYFHGVPDISLSYSIELADLQRTLYLVIDGLNLTCSYEPPELPTRNVALKMRRSILDSILMGNITIQTAFMSGNLTAKGDLKLLGHFDKIFPFE